MPRGYLEPEPPPLTPRSRSWSSRADSDEWSESADRPNASLAALHEVLNSHEELGSLPEPVLRTSASLLDMLEQGRFAESRQLTAQILRSNAPLLQHRDYQENQLERSFPQTARSVGSNRHHYLRVSSLAASQPSQQEYTSVVEEALQNQEQDAQEYLERVEARMIMMGVHPPTVTLRFKDLFVETSGYTDLSRNLPSVIGFYRRCIEWVLEKVWILHPNKQKLIILNNVSGTLQPGRLTLLLGPPASGKTTLLKALAGVLNSKDLKVEGSVTYNSKSLKKFVPIRTAAYVEQSDTHIGELTVRETLDFAARCQGSGSLKEILVELRKREEELGIEADSSMDGLLQLEAEEGLARSVRSEFIIRMLGLGICANTMVGDRMHRGVSGGQKKRVTSGEMLVAQKRVLFMDEPSTGLDSSTTFQIIKYLRDLTHTQQNTTLVSLLQPDPETYHLFDDVLLIAEGRVVYHGPVQHAATYFAKLGFHCPERKGIADFLQEVTSLKDQEQYWSRSDKPYKHVTVTHFSKVYERSRVGRSQQWHLAVEADKEAKESIASALVTTPYALSNWQMFKACWDREFILVKRNMLLYVFRFVNTMVVGLITAFTFFRTKLQPDSLIMANRYFSVLFFSLIMLMFDASTEMLLGLNRLAGFYKQRDNNFYASWAFVLPTTLLRIPYSFLVALLWSSVVYYVVGLAPEFSRFTYFMCILFLIHSMAVGMFRAAAAIARDPTIAPTFGSFFYLVLLMCGGFLLSKGNIPSWWAWFYWIDPLAFAQKGIALNEFGAPRWQIREVGNITIEDAILGQRNLPQHGYERWLGFGAVAFVWFILNVVTWLAYAYLNALDKPATVLPPAIQEAIAKGAAGKPPKEKKWKAKQGRQSVELSFQPLTLTFRHINYFVDMPQAMDETDPDKLGPQPVDVDGVTMLQLLRDCSGAYQPGVLTAMVGSSGAGKTTLMDVIAGRKTTGKLTGDIRISGFLKDQGSFARVSGYVEQFDIHSPCTTVGEALWISARLRFGREVGDDTVQNFIQQVEALVELESLRRSLVGIPGKSGLSVEQRKRLTIAIELVANPSLVFMDEPTSGLDARAAAIVMRTVRATADTGRTVVCTIHQPSIDIFEAFDNLLLMQIGGRIIYHGPLGDRSARLVQYFEAIPGVPALREGLNPATWMLQISKAGMEKSIAVDFAAEFCHSAALREMEELLDLLEVPPEDSRPLHFRSRYAQPQVAQFWELLKRNFTSYSRSPGYNGTRFIFGAVLGLLFGSLFWQKGQNRATLQEVYNIMGALYLAMLFLSFINSSSVQAVVSYERSVSFRETAAGMYSSLAFGLAACIVEIPYIFVQNALFCAVSYWMIGFEASATKFFYYLLFIFLNLFLMTNYGIMAVYATPSLPVAGICSSMFFGIWNLFAGYIVPRSLIPIWFRWYTYLDPIHWALYGIITSQLGDVKDQMVLGPGLPTMAVQDFLAEEFDYHHSFLPWVAVIMLGYGIAFAFIGVLALQMLKYQKR